MDPTEYVPSSYHMRRERDPISEKLLSSFLELHTMHKTQNHSNSKDRSVLHITYLFH
jgi:hypothetical protein